MQEKMIKEKRTNILDEIDTAKMKVKHAQLKLKKNLEDINNILRLMKKTRKIISCLRYLKLNWLKNNSYEDQLKLAEKRLKDFSNLYEITILKRKILKEQFKGAQRKFSKKQRSIIRFINKYRPEKKE